MDCAITKRASVSLLGEHDTGHGGRTVHGRGRNLWCRHIRSVSGMSMCYIYFKNTKNLFIHIARIPIGDSPRVHPNIFKMSPPFASSEGYSASGVRYQSDGECVTHLLPHS